MIELVGGYPAQSRSAGRRTTTPYGHRESWRRIWHGAWMLLNAPAMVDGGRGSLEGGALTEDDRRVRARSRTRH